MDLLIVEIPREEKLQEILGDLCDGRFRGKIHAVDVIDAPVLDVRLEQVVGESRDRFTHGRSIVQVGDTRKRT